MNKEKLRNDRKALIDILEQVGAKFKGNICNCPFHNDEHPSAGVYEKNGVWRFKCMVCEISSDIYDMQAKLDNTSPSEQLKKLCRTKRQTKTKQQSFANLDSVRQYLTKKLGKIEYEHEYKNADGDVAYYVFRCLTLNGKTLRPVSLSDTGYILKMPDKPWLLYNLPDVMKVENVIVVEGKKNVIT